MHVLVTGGAGYLGSHFVLALLDAGHQPVVLDNLSRGIVEAIPAHVPLIRADLSDTAALDKGLVDFRIDAVAHFAGPTPSTPPWRAYRDCIAPTASLLSAMARAGVVRLVFASSAHVYGSPSGAASERAPAAPTTAFGRAKLAAEWLIHDMAAATELRYALVRVFGVEGADPYLRTGPHGIPETPLATAVAAACGRTRAAVIDGDDLATPDGTRRRDIVHVSDVANAHLCALEWTEGTDRAGVFNCASGDAVSTAEVVAAIEAAVGTPILRSIETGLPGDAETLSGDVGWTARTLGWRPRRSELTTIAQDALTWERRESGRRG